MHEKPKRRWLRFSVRTLLVAVTIFCVSLGWTAWQLSIVRERQTLLELVLEDGAQIIQSSSTDAAVTAASHGWTLVSNATRYRTKTRKRTIRQALPWFRENLGDEAITAIALPQRFRDDEVVQQLRSHFPEAMIYCFAPGSRPAEQAKYFRRIHDSK